MLKRLWFLLFLFCAPQFCHSQAACSVTYGFNGGPTNQFVDSFIIGNEFTAVAGHLSVDTIVVLYGGVGPTTVVAGIYTDASGTPGTLIVSGTTTATNNQGAVPVPISTTTLTLGTNYWVEFQCSEGYRAFASGAPGNYAYKAFTYTGSLPSPFMADGTVSGDQANVFADFCGTGNTATPTLTPTNTQTPTFTPTNTPTQTFTPTSTNTPIPGSGHFWDGMNLLGVRASLNGSTPPFNVAAGLFVFGIDSLSNLPQEITSQIRQDVWTKFGYGGGGLFMFDSNSADYDGNATYKSSGVTYIVNDVNSNGYFFPANWSISGFGAQANPGSNDSLDYVLGTTTFPIAQNSAVYYLKQPGGGTFVAGWAPVTEGTQYQPVTVNTSSGVTAVASVTLATNVSDPVMSIQQINGNVVVFGFTNTNPTGAAASKACHDGQRMMAFSTVSTVAMQEWASLLPNFTGFFLNGGMNDSAHGITGPVFQACQSIYVSALLAGNPSLKVMIIKCNQPANYAVTDLPAFRAAQDNLVATMPQLGLFDYVQFMGTYANANANGWMLDGTHPSQTGIDNVIIPAFEHYLGWN